MGKCIFDMHGVCHALTCYYRQHCGARDKKGNPIYATLEHLKIKKK